LPAAAALFAASALALVGKFLVRLNARRLTAFAADGS
jgi:hypothetical protein